MFVVAKMVVLNVLVGLQGLYRAYSIRQDPFYGQDVLYIPDGEMAIAGYNPDEGAELWKRMKAKSGGQAPPEFMSTHPSPKRRVENIEENARNRGCSGKEGSNAEYTRIKNSL